MKNESGLYWLAARDENRDGLWQPHKSLDCEMKPLNFASANMSQWNGTCAVAKGHTILDSKCHWIKPVICQRPNFDISEGENIWFVNIRLC